MIMMSEMLSQEEIDALLKGDSATAPQDNSSSQAGHDSVLEKKDFDTANLSRKSKIEQNTPRYATILCNIKRYF